MILVTGALGQIGVDLVERLERMHGPENVIATDLRARQPKVGLNGRFDHLDVTDRDELDRILDAKKITTVYHLAGILSAKGEEKPDLCWRVNINGLKSVLSAAQKRGLKVFWPSSIAVFGHNTPRDDTPQSAVTDPSTMYGITKVMGELLCRYYAERYSVDIRSIRFPGIISYNAPPGGGTTDFAVDMFFQALESGTYECFVAPKTRLPMMYMDDAVKSVIDLMAAKSKHITVRTSYNVTAFSFSAEELAAVIRKYVPEFGCTYRPDFRQEIADTWPRTIDDSTARRDWNWKPDFDLDAMARDMLENVGRAVGTPSPTSSVSRYK